MHFTQELIDTTVAALQSGHVILYPTDTIWGIGCDISNQSAVNRVMEIKSRPADKPLILLVADIEMLEHYVEHIPPKIHLLHEFHERPFTVVYEQPKNLPDYLLAPDGSIAIRVPQDPFCQQMIRAFGSPITSTSANLSGEPSPISFDTISDQLKSEVDFIVQYRLDEPLTSASAVLKVGDDGELFFFRE